MTPITPVASPVASPFSASFERESGPGDAGVAGVATFPTSTGGVLYEHQETSLS